MARRRRRRRQLTAALIAAMTIALGGCRTQERPVEPPPTVVLCSEPMRAMMEEEAAQYNSLYPASTVLIHAAETREAIVHLLNDSVRNVAVDRPLNDEERAVAKDAGLRLVENAFAKDGLAVVVHRSNPLDSVSLASIRAIVARTTEMWRAIPESRLSAAIDLVLTGRNAGTGELLRALLKLNAAVQPTTVVRSQEEALAYVASHTGSITFISTILLPRLPAGVRVVAVEAREIHDNVRFVRPTQMDLYQSLYPLQYSLYLYNAESKAAVGTGFSTFVIKTLTGQKIVQNTGLAPVNIPNRVIQLNPE